jgi:predicted RND superfamily exporter protein
MTVWSFLHRIRIPLFALAAGITALLLPSAMGLETDPSNLSLLENDQALRDHETFVRRFGSDDSVIVALESENALSGEVLAWIDRFAGAQMSDPAAAADSPRTIVGKETIFHPAMETRRKKISEPDPKLY